MTFSKNAITHQSKNEKGIKIVHMQRKFQYFNNVRLLME